jgi:hypothetical protein
MTRAACSTSCATSLQRLRLDLGRAAAAVHQRHVQLAFAALQRHGPAQQALQPAQRAGLAARRAALDGWLGGGGLAGRRTLGHAKPDCAAWWVICLSAATAPT